MLQFLKHILQLMLSPAKGWEDVSQASEAPAELCSRGLYPLLGIAALSNFVRMLYGNGILLVTAIERAVVDFGAYFVTVYIARLVFDIYVGRFTAGQPPRERVTVPTAVAVGILLPIHISDNILPWNLVLLRFLPLYAVLVLYKSSSYMDVPTSREMNYMIMATLATVVTPLVIYYFFFFLLP